MSESGNNKELANKKSYEVAYALFRIAGQIADFGIAKKIKDGATEVLAATVSGEYGKAAIELQALDYIVKLAVDTGTIRFLNGDILMREIGNLNALLAGQMDSVGQAVDISGFFLPEPAGNYNEPVRESTSHNTMPSSTVKQEKKIGVDDLISIPPDHLHDQRGKQAEEVRQEKSQNPLDDREYHFLPKVAVGVQDAESESGNNPATGFLKSGMRQIAILDKIRQSGNCRLKDIQEVLPDTSERTIRYDLEDLMERRLIERVGSGGPAIYYKMRQK